MTSAVTWLCSDNPPKRRVYDVLGADAAVRADVLARIETLVAPESVLRMDARRTPARSVWASLALAPLPSPGARTPGARLVVVTGADAMRDWSGLDRFIDQRSTYAETVLVLVSDREQVGHRARVERRHAVPGSPSWETRLWPWEQRIRDYTGGQQIVCSPPSVESLHATRGKAPSPSPAARWLSLRLPVTQRQAEAVWARSGASSALARDVVESFKVATGCSDATRLPPGDFTARIEAILSAHGAADVAELILFARRDQAFAALADHSFTSKDWTKVLGYLAQRLDWLGPLHEALRTKEDLGAVQKRLVIHQKWILTYAHRENPANNIAKHYDRAKVRRCRALLAEASHALAEVPGVPPAFGEVLIAAW